MELDCSSLVYPAVAEPSAMVGQAFVLLMGCLFFSKSRLASADVHYALKEGISLPISLSLSVSLCVCVCMCLSLTHTPEFTHWALEYRHL